jgi:predicted RNA binding protein YcfA (HicA-like mRNA interferase family)
MRRLRSRDEWLARRILSGRSDANIGFAELRRLLLTLGFSERVRGSHHVYVRDGVDELINLQRAGAQAKPYQVRQVRAVLRRYELIGGE